MSPSLPAGQIIAAVTVPLKHGACLIALAEGLTYVFVTVMSPPLGSGQAA
jgi:hypothetical protein